MKIIKHKNLFVGLSVLLMIVSAVVISVFGFNLSVDFKGGSVYEISYQENVPNSGMIKDATQNVGIQSAVIQQVGENNFVIKTTEINEDVKVKLKKELTFNDKFEFTEEREKTIGPAVSSELAKKSLFAILFVAMAIVFFIGYVFSGVSKPVRSFKYGLVAVVALIHDILIPTAVFSVLGTFMVSYQIDVLFVTALLAILGFSVNDTIVVFDRIRENLKNSKEKNIKGKKFETIVGHSLDETIIRSLNTSITTLVVLLALFFIGGDILKPFALVLAIGTIAGTYSSIFFASPLLVLIEKYQKEPKVDENKEKENKKKEATEEQIEEALRRIQSGEEKF